MGRDIIINSMMRLGEFVFSATYVNMLLLITLIIILLIVFFFFNKRLNSFAKEHKKDKEKIRAIEKTYGYLEFLDNANQRLYEKYLKEKSKNKPN